MTSSEVSDDLAELQSIISFTDRWPCSSIILFPGFVQSSGRIAFINITPHYGSHEYGKIMRYHNFLFCIAMPMLLHFLLPCSFCNFVCGPRCLYLRAYFLCLFTFSQSHVTLSLRQFIKSQTQLLGDLTLGIGCWTVTVDVYFSLETQIHLNRSYLLISSKN